jgi:hypothetical protein
MTHELNSGELLQQLEQYIDVRRDWLKEAVGIVTGDPETPIEDVFQEPTSDPEEARRDYEMRFSLSESQETGLRAVASRFDIGGAEDVSLDDVGLAPNHVRMDESGLFRKMLAEAEVDSEAGTEIHAGSKYVVLKDTEKELEAKVLGESMSTNQYEAAQHIAESRPGFEPLAKPIVMPFGYDIDNNFALVHEPKGQLIHIGNRGGKPVMMLSVDREVFKDEAGASKYRKQPDTAALMGFIADVLSACGDEETAVGYVTSNTYASRNLDALRAGYSRGRRFGTAMYGRKTLAHVEGKTEWEETEMFQIPGELRVMDIKLNQLDESIHNS